MNIGSNACCWITKRPVLPERTILNEYGNLIRAAWETKPLILRVANNVEASQPGVNVEARDTNRMIVVPESLRALFVRIQEDCILARSYPILRIAVALGWNICSVQMYNGANRGYACIGSVNRRIHREQVLRGEIVDPVYGDALIAKCLERGPGIDASINPKFRWRQIAVQLLRDLGHRHLVIRSPSEACLRLRNGWNRHAVDKARQTADTTVIDGAR